jgi:DnaK suppressor protein
MKKLIAKKPAKKAAAKPVGNVDYYQKKLEIMRDDLLKTVSKKREEAEPDADVGDEGDVAARSVARDLVFELTDNEKHLLDEVEAALRRVEKGVFGLCEACGDQIKVARLKFMPYARYCIKCQARFEHS